MPRTVTFTDTEFVRVSIALLGDIDRGTEHIETCRKLAARHPHERDWADNAVDRARRRGIARQAYTTLHGLTPSHFTFNEKL